MKKLFLLCLVAVFAFCSVGAVSAAQVFKLAENQPEDYPTTIGDRAFAKMVDEKTNGEIKIDVYHGGQLGDEKSVIEAVQMGGIEFARVNAQPLSDFNSDLLVVSLPYLFRDSDHLWKVLDGPIGDELLKKLDANGMIGLAFYDSGSRSFYNSKREVKTPDDLKGLKIRVQQSKLMMGLVSALGASPTPMPYGEVYTGLQSGVIDGAENNWPSYYSTSHYEVAPFFTLDHHTRTPEVVIMSKAVWDKLTPEHQKIIRESARASQEIQKAAWKEYEQKSIEAVKAKGNTITEVSDLSKWQNAVKPLYPELAPGSDEIVKKIEATK